MASVDANTHSESIPPHEGAVVPRQSAALTDAIPDTLAQDTRRDALLILQGMQDGLDRLALQTRSRSVQRIIAQLREVVTCKLIDRAPPQNAERDTALMVWAQMHQIDGDTPFSVQGAIIRSCARSIRNLVFMLCRREPQSEGMVNDLQTVSFRALKTCAWEFDPRTHGEDFWKFAESIILTAIRAGIKNSSEMLSTHHDLASLIALRDADPAHGQRFAQPEAAEWKAPEDPSVAAPWTAPLDGQKRRRNAAIMRWSRTHNFDGATVYQVQGCIIRRNIPWMAEIAKAECIRDGDSAVSLDELKTAGYRVLTACAVVFNPDVDGVDFRKFCAPYLISALRHCIREGGLAIPNRPTMDILRLISEGAPSITGSAEQQEPETMEEPSDQQIRAEAHDPAPAPAQPDEHAPAQLAAEPELTSEQEQEHKRKRRFCRWAKDEHQIPVTQEQFDLAVQEIANKHHPLAKGIVDRIKNLNTFRGGKSAVRREAYRLLPERVRDFDPAGGEHFNQFVVVWLEARLQEFVAGNGKRHAKNV